MIFLRRYGKGPAILLVHGFPRTSLMWRFLAPKLAESPIVICVDLRPYGRSGIPASTDDHFPYSKRAMAKELIEVMDKLGFRTFTLVGHDRGGRVSYRLALDHPTKVERLAVLDVIPILEAWSRSDARFAQTYWPWILLSQKSPLPERYLLGAPQAVFHNPFGHRSFGPEILEAYVSNYRDPARVHGICEEYRAAAMIDVEHDRAVQTNRMPDAAFVGRGWPARQFLCKRRWSSRHLAAMGSAGARTANEGRPLFPGRES
jgi:haloacetate dehalogenase